jgi:hypothetical protein
MPATVIDLDDYSNGALTLMWESLEMCSAPPGSYDESLRGRIANVLLARLLSDSSVGPVLRTDNG